VNFIDLASHLLGFLAPALAVALLVAVIGRLVFPRNNRPQRWWVSVALNFVAGSLVLAAGLWWFGRDGKMATYAALVVAVATCEWLIGRGWRS
jgi:riboflavin transporter FmnP